MYCNNAKINEDLIVGEKISITDFKHTAVYGELNYTQFGEMDVDSHLKGKNIKSTAKELYISESDGNSTFANKFIRLQSGGTPYHGDNSIVAGITLIANNDIIMQSSGDENNIRIIGGNDVQISSNSKLRLYQNKGITVDGSVYGTSLPTDNNENGRIFFKLIS